MATYRVPVLQDFNWQPNIKDKDLGTPPGGESKGDRYIVSANGGAWSDGAAKDIAWYDGSGWHFDTPAEGWQCWVEDENDYYYFNGSDWIIIDATANASDISSHTIQIASLESKEVVDRASIDSVETIASANASNISSHTIQIAANISDISSHTIQVASLESMQVVDRASIDSVETVASDAAVAAAANTSDVSSHTIQIASLESKEVVDRASIDSVETIASANASNISSHTIQIAANESNISSHTIEIASAQEEGTYVAEYGAIEFTI